MALEPAKRKSKKTPFKPSKKSKMEGRVSNSSNPRYPDVVPVTGDANPFRNAAFTLSRAAWNRLRVFIQLVNAFPVPDDRRSIVIDLIKDLLLAVGAYWITWSKLSQDHKQLMVSFVSTIILL